MLIYVDCVCDFVMFIPVGFVEWRIVIHNELVLDVRSG